MRRLALVGSAVTMTVLCSSTAAVAAARPASLQAVGAGTDTSAAATLGWGAPDRAEEFSAPLGSAWGVYNGSGHNGNGRRTPSAVRVADGIMTITGDAAGNTAGMAWGPGRRYGRWEGRVRAPVGDPSYNALMLLWPDAENWPVGGEVDFMEMSDSTRQSTNMFLHYGASNSQISGEVAVDATQWHDWAVEWAPDHITAFVDGRQWFRTTNTSILPPGPMHLCIQLDWFPRGGGRVRPTTMEVDRVRQYPYRDRAVPAPTSTPTTTPTTAAPSSQPSRPVPDVTPSPTRPRPAPATPAPTRTRAPAPGSSTGPDAIDPAADIRAWVRRLVELYRMRMVAAFGGRYPR